MLSQFLLTFTAIAVAQDILGAVPIYLSLTKKLSATDQKQSLKTSILIAFGVALSFCLMSHLILTGLNITLPDLKMAGGLVLLAISIVDLTGTPHSETPLSGSAGSVIPLAIPVITGPAVLTTVIAQVHSAGYLITLAALVSNYALSWVILRKSSIVQKLVGKDGIMIMSKIAALLLAAIAVSMMRSGIVEVIRGLK